MATAEELTQAKRRVSASVLQLPGVAGVGMSEQSVRVYLENASPALRERVNEAIQPLKLTVPVDFQASGMFSKF